VLLPNITLAAIGKKHMAGYGSKVANRAVEFPERY